MTFDVAIDVMQPMDGVFMVQGRITNLGTDEIDVPEIEWEFLDGAGNVLSTQVMPGRILAPEATEAFALEDVTEDVVAARYSVLE